MNAWLGHSSRIAEKHYLQVTPEHWAKAIGGHAGGHICANHPGSTALSESINAGNLLPDGSRFPVILDIAPRGGRYPNRGFVELGAFRTKRLRRLPRIEMFKWNSILDRIQAESESAKPKRDRMRLARQYQALLASGEVESRAELARFLGVSRSRVTQVLNRLRPVSNVTDSEQSRPTDER